MHLRTHSANTITHDPLFRKHFTKFSRFAAGQGKTASPVRKKSKANSALSKLLEEDTEDDDAAGTAQD